MLTLYAGVGSSSTMIQAVKNLPHQQQLLICAATKLLGVGSQDQPMGNAASQGARLSLSGVPIKVRLHGRGCSHLLCEVTFA